MITSIFPTICADDVSATKDFYVELFGFEVIFDSGWYVQLESPDGTKPQLGIVEREHHTVPEAFRLKPAGIVVSIEVDDVDKVHAQVLDKGYELPVSLRDETFGQRHFITIDPSGTLVDVITPIPAGEEYVDAGRTE
jgi:catechol 2,3-dioxygenase-like lactoylglutathione lyase family enzyme